MRYEVKRVHFVGIGGAGMSGIAEVMVPRQIEIRPALPLLATGKIDYPKLMASLTP